MFSRAPADRGLLLLPPLLPLPQVGRGVLGSGTAGRVCARRALARAHPCPRRWRWVSWKAAATPRTSKSGAGAGEAAVTPVPLDGVAWPAGTEFDSGVAATGGAILEVRVVVSLVGLF